MPNLPNLKPSDILEVSRFRCGVAVQMGAQAETLVLMKNYRGGKATVTPLGIYVDTPKAKMMVPFANILWYEPVFIDVPVAKVG